MTLFQMFEQNKQHFPNVGLTQFTKDVNLAQRYFAHDTRILVKQANLTIVSNTVEYTLSTEFSDIDGELVKEILFKDSNGELLDSSDTLKFTITNGKIRFYDYYGDSITTIPSSISTITFIYVYVPTDLSNDTDEPVLDDQFHDALLYRVLMKYYVTFPMTQVINGQTIISISTSTSKYFHDLYKELELSAKRKANEYTPMHTGISGL